MARWLEGKTIVVGISGGIACYKAAELVRLLTTAGALVRVAMTANATKFIAPLTLQTLSGERVATDTFDLGQESEIGHIRLAETADAIVIAPATANVIGKAAAGIADDLLTTVLLATRAPILVAPSMNVNMYENPIVQENLEKLRDRGFVIVEPDSGFLACGYEGPGRLAEPVEIVNEVCRTTGPQDMAGERVLVSAGPTREAVDPVRFVSNRSSGKMGYALAAAAWRRGGEVVLVTGPSEINVPRGVRCVSVVTAAEMKKAMLHEARRANLVVMAAAVADYRPKNPAEQKVKKAASQLEVEWERTVDILAELGRRKGKRFLVGFAAETENVVANAERKLREKRLDLVVLNDVSRSDAGFDVDTNAVHLIDALGREEVGLGTKDEIADLIFDRIVLLRSKAARPRRAARRASGEGTAES